MPNCRLDFPGWRPHAHRPALTQQPPAVSAAWPRRRRPAAADAPDAMELCCGDSQQDCDSICGPSIKLQRNLPVFKARRQCNTWLQSEESALDTGDADEDEEDTLTESSEMACTDLLPPLLQSPSPSMLPPPLSPVAAIVAPSGRNHQRTGVANKLRRQATPPARRPPARRADQRLSDSPDSATSDCSWRSFPTEEKHPPPPPKPEPKLKPPSSSPPARRVRIRPQAARLVRACPVLDEKARREVRHEAEAAEASCQARRERQQQQQQQSTPSLQSSPASCQADVEIVIDRNEPGNEVSPIDYMEVYHRLRKGRFGFLYDYPRPNRKLQPQPKATRSRNNSPASAGTASSGDRDSGLTHLLRLLRDQALRQSTTDPPKRPPSPTETPHSPTPPSSPPHSAPPPVPKPRMSASSQTTSLKSEKAVQAPRASNSLCSTAASAIAKPRTAGPSCAARQRRSAPQANRCPFATTAICSAESIEPPRTCSLMPTLVPTAGALELARWPLRYRCAEWRMEQRLSVTGRLLKRRDGHAPCRWLGSSALLTQTRHPIHIELPAASTTGVAGRREASATAAPVRHVDADGEFRPAAAVDAEPTLYARYAYLAINKCRRAPAAGQGPTGADHRRRTSGASRRDAGSVNLYAVSAS